MYVVLIVYLVYSKFYMLLAVPTSINTNIISDIAAHAVPTQKAILSECPCPCLCFSHSQIGNAQEEANAKKK